MDQRKYLTDGEVDQLRRITEQHAQADEAKGRTTGPRRWIVVDLALSTGLRVSELAALTWGDFDGPRDLLTVRRLKRRVCRSEALPIPPALTAHLRHWRRLCPSVADPAPIVPGAVGRPLTRSSWRRVWQQSCRHAGVPVLPIHAARHTVAHRVMASEGLAVAQHTLGHATPTITSNMYGHVTPDQIRAALSGIGTQGDDHGS